MRTFTIGDLEIDIRRHVRVDGSRFPAPSPDYVADYFVITARWQGNAIDFYPNEGKPNDPLAVGWIGKKVLPVYENQGTEADPVMVQVGTKRGADFRRRMFKMFAYRLGKAVLARQLGKTIGQVTQADIDAVTAPRLRAALRGTFADPVDLTQFTLDNACRHLRDADGDLEEGEKPPGTVANIDCDFDSWATGTGTESETGTRINVQGSSSAASQNRGQFRHSLSSLPADATINDVDHQVNVTNDASGPVDIHAYNGTGADDPDTDIGTTKFSRSIGGTPLVSGSSAFTPNGSRTVDLGASADSAVESNISSPGFFSLGYRLQDDTTTANFFQMEAIEDAGTDPATLIVDYTAGATGNPWYYYAQQR